MMWQDCGNHRKDNAMPDPFSPDIPPLPPHMVGAPRMVPRAFGAATPVRMPTLMLVEDSRYASEVMRLYARSLGLRLRRAADLDSADTHLRLYQPDIVMVDLGLPDGRGEGLIARLAQAPHRPPLLIAVSGQGELAPGARAAGADVFIEKPLPNIADFRALLVEHFPAPLPLLLLPDRAPSPQPDRMALKDDLDFAAQTLSIPADTGDAPLLRARTRYVAGLLDGIAGSLGDGALQTAARDEMLRCGSEQAGGSAAGSASDRGAAKDADMGAQSFRRLRDLVNQRLRDMLEERGI
jgi:CheY-like chemotaxis protein